MVKTFLVQVKDNWSTKSPRVFRVSIDEDKASERGVRSDARYLTRAANSFWDRERYRVTVELSPTPRLVEVWHEQVVEL
jgi:hypothetical protein